MWIVAEAAESRITAGELIFVLTVVAAALALAAGVGVFRASSVVGPSRVPPGRPLWPLVVLMLGGLFAWGAMIDLYKHSREERWRLGQADPLAAWDVSKLTPLDYAFLATVPPLAAYVIVSAGDAVVRRIAWQRLGTGLDQIAPGMWRGLVGALIAVPLVFGVMVATEQIYRFVDYPHPSEHDLLRILKAAPSRLVAGSIIAGAVVAAPLWEELLFRGHLQSVLRAGLENLWRRRAGTPGHVDDGPGLAAPSPWVPWLAIVATSVAFTAVHAPWSRPPIFVLSVALGYAYERTANLWTAVVMHALFNGTMTAIFIASQTSGGA